ncbi:MAG: hypothetical protein AAGJ94_17375 [Pseudomonadota bacterium]
MRYGGGVTVVDLLGRLAQRGRAEVGAMGEFAAFFSQFDAVLSLALAALVALPALLRKRRPLTKSRAMDISLSALLFAVLGVRFAVLCGCVALYPEAALPGAGPGVVSVLGALYATAALVGLATHRAGVMARVVGALVLGVVSLVEVIMSGFVLNASLAMRVDAVLALALAAAAGVFAAFFWTYRTATPNPLGSDKRPFDY